jgi:hypothetical protein
LRRLEIGKRGLGFLLLVAIFARIGDLLLLGNRGGSIRPAGCHEPNGL